MPVRHVIVDGSNLATEGRSLPSLSQLDQAVREFLAENPGDVVTVVVDASFGHRIDPSELPVFEEAEEAGEVVSPPAGAIGRGDAFLLRIAEKTGATVLSNDSFQEFHGEHVWLFDDGRLIGGKPVPGVGWIFMPRTPVRGQKSREVVKEAKRKKRAEDGADGVDATAGGSGLDLAASRSKGRPKKVDRAIARATEEAVEPAAVARRRRRASTLPPADPVNEPLAFITFIAAHPLGSEVVGTVAEFSSHGAFVDADGARCYLPLSAMGDPPPRRAREVVGKGEERSFVVQALDPQRRGVELALPGFAHVAGGPTEETVEAEIHPQIEAAPKRRRAQKAVAAAPAGPDGPGQAVTAGHPDEPVAEVPEVPEVPAAAAPRSRPVRKTAGAGKAPAAKKVAGVPAPAKKAATRKAPAKDVALTVGRTGSGAKKAAAAKPAAPAGKAAATPQPAPAAEPPTPPPPTPPRPAKKAAVVKTAPAKKAVASGSVASKAKAATAKRPAAKKEAAKAAAPAARATSVKKAAAAPKPDPEPAPAPDPERAPGPAGGCAPDSRGGQDDRTVPGQPDLTVPTIPYDGARMRIATWNVNSLKIRLPRVEEWLAYARPDVLCLQETKLADAAFPHMAFAALGYESVHHGDGRWNGVAVLSRVGVEDVVYGFAGPLDPDSDTRIITARCGGISVSSVYVPNGRSLDSDHYQYKLGWMGKLGQHLDVVTRPDEKVVVCGDFNIAPEDIDVWDPQAFAGATHVSEPERQALRALESWGLVDAFRARYPDDRLFSYWDYRAGDFHEHRGMRIDLVLVSQPLADAVTWALVDRNARKGKLPSDHAPVLVDVDVDAA